ncbi:hypothetical protein RJT34_01542 [Clitoria ternatea]|uniref:DYW domain-containing protein n=1 Tax=Clitoria ternatea TaxID=43366 RepID=A0AAN9KJM4_CLITE
MTWHYSFFHTTNLHYLSSLRIQLPKLATHYTRKLCTINLSRNPQNQSYNIHFHPNPQLSRFPQKGFSDITQLTVGKAVHALCVKGLIQLGTFYTNTLINMYSKFGHIEQAQHVFDRMSQRNESSWNNMISGFVRAGLYGEAMRFFCYMCECDVQPSSYVVASILTACDRYGGCISEGALQIHAYIVKCGLMFDVFVGTCLLNFYGGCGKVFEVERVFEEIEEPNIVSWTSLMVAYAYGGYMREVLSVFRRLRSDGLCCNENMMATVVRCCGMLGDKYLGYQVFSNVIKFGLDTSVSVANSLVSMFGNCESMEEATCVFGGMKERDTISWNSIIAASVHNGYCEESLEYFLQICRTRVETNYITLATLLPVCGSSENLRWGRGLHGLVVKSGLEANVCVCNSLVSMYSQAGKPEDAEFVFHKMPDRDLISWNSMMACHVENGKHPCAIQLLIEMLQTRRVVNYVTFTTALSACYNLEKLKIVHAFVVLFGLHNLITGNTLVTMYGKFGSMAEARQVCKVMPKRDEVTWNALIGGHSGSKEPNAAIEAFNLMREEGVPVNYITIVNLLSACLSPDGILEHGMPIHAHIVVAGFELDTFVQSSLITMYAQCGDLHTSNYIFDVLANKNSSTWNAILSANGHYGPGEEALVLMVKMTNDGVHLDQFSFSIALAIIGNLTLLDVGQQLHSLIIKLGFELNDYVLNATMDMYGKCGEIDDVLRILPQPRSRSQRSWNILISAFARHGFFQQATEAFHEMLDLGLRPDHVTFVSLLSACSHGGLVDEGLAYFSSMATEFGVLTGIEHCVCIVDLLGRAGRLSEAETFINNMPIPPNDLVWRSLLAACKIHGNLELSRKAADRLFELDSSDDSAYVLYSNVCASTSRWGDVENVRKRMESHNIKKKPACSWIKTKNKVTTFGMGDQYHPQKAQIYAKLEELKKMIREAGYVPDTSYSLQDTDEEQKEHNLWNHSERIALAFGLINSTEGSPLRIFKNLRVCGDCHSVFKLVSQIVGRKIILRDAYRFHHFSRGKCSCSDYW